MSLLLWLTLGVVLLLLPVGVWLGLKILALYVLERQWPR